MAYEVTITASDGRKQTYKCGGGSDEEALIYAGKVVEQQAGEFDADASVTISNDKHPIGPAATVADMTRRAV